MRRRTLLLATCVALPVALAAAAQQEADRRLDAAIARARAALGPGNALEIRERRVDPVSGEARLTGVTLRRNNDILTIEEVTLRDVDEARVGSATARGLRLAEASAGASPGGKNAPAVAREIGETTAARATLAGLRLPEVAGGPGVDWSAVAVDSAVIETIAFGIPGQGGGGIARVALTGYAPGTAREAVMEGLRYEAGNAAVTAGRFRIGRARLAGAVLPRPGQDFDPWSFAADSAAVEGLDMEVPEAGSTTDGRIHLGRFQVDGWGEGRLTRAELADFRVAGTESSAGPFEVGLGGTALSGLPVRDIAHALTTGTNPPVGAPGQEQNLEMTGLTVALGGTQWVGIGAIRLSGGVDAAQPQVAVSRLAVEGIAVDLPAGFGGDWLDELGYKGISGAINIPARLDMGSGWLLSDPFTIRVDGMGTLGFAMDLRGYPVPHPGQPAPAPEDAVAQMMNLQVASMTVRYVEEGLIGRLIAQQARQTRRTEALLREQYAGMALQMPVPGDGAGKADPRIARIRQALASFARQPGTVEFTMRPPQPLPLSDLADLGSLEPGEVVSRLGLTATATPPRR